MRRGRDTGTIRLDRQAIKDIVENCSHPELMREILKVKTWDLALKKISLFDFHLHCRSLVTGLGPEGACILWQPADLKQRHVDVRTVDSMERKMVHVARVVWTVCQVVTAQGSMLGREEELHHSCGLNGAKNTAFGCCLNPSHLVRGDEQTRIALRAARAKFDKVMKRQTAVSVAS